MKDDAAHDESTPVTPKPRMRWRILWVPTLRWLYLLVGAAEFLSVLLAGTSLCVDGVTRFSVAWLALQAVFLCFAARVFVLRVADPESPRK